MLRLKRKDQFECKVLWNVFVPTFADNVCFAQHALASILTQPLLTPRMKWLIPVLFIGQ